jgi:hypothetical protein
MVQVDSIQEPDRKASVTNSESTVLAKTTNATRSVAY